jgi:hypothetical protein
MDRSNFHESEEGFTYVRTKHNDEKVVIEYHQGLAPPTIGDDNFLL